MEQRGDHEALSAALSVLPERIPARPARDDSEQQHKAEAAVVDTVAHTNFYNINQ